MISINANLGVVEVVSEGARPTRIPLAPVLMAGLGLLLVAVQGYAQVNPCTEGCIGVSVSSPSGTFQSGNTFQTTVSYQRGPGDKGLDDETAIAFSVALPSLSLADCAAPTVDGLTAAIVPDPEIASRFLVVVENTVCTGDAKPCLCPGTGQSKAQHINVVIYGPRDLPIPGSGSVALPILPTGNLLTLTLKVDNPTSTPLKLHIYNRTDNEGTTPKPQFSFRAQVGDTSLVDDSVNHTSNTSNMRFTDGLVSVMTSSLTQTATVRPTATNTAVPTSTPVLTTTIPTATSTRTVTKTLTGTPSPTPTPTQTNTRTQTITLTLTRTPIETGTPTVTPRFARIKVSLPSAGPGETVPVSVFLESAGFSLAATGNDLTFDPRIVDIDPMACRISPSLGKSLVASVVDVSTSSKTVRFFVQSTQGNSPIPDGGMYSCPAKVAASAFPGEYLLRNINVVGFGPSGTRVDSVIGTDGILNVSLLPSLCPGDCNADRAVGIDDLRLAVTVALGQAPLSRCLSLDRSNDQLATVEEIIAGVNNHLGSCP